MRIGSNERDCLFRFLGHSDDEGWFGFKRARTISGDWPVMRKLIAKGLLETKSHEKWVDCRKARVTEKGKEIYGNNTCHTPADASQEALLCCPFCGSKYQGWTG